MGELDRDVARLLRNRYPEGLERWTADMVMRWDFRESDHSLAPGVRRELAALAAAMPEAGGERLSSYHRLFLDQSFVELTRRLDDVLLEGNMFAAAARPKGGGERGNLVIGRSFFADLGLDVEPDRLVTIVHPDGKYPFASVGWAGLMGVVTGINARGIFVALDPTRTDDALEEGVPLPLILRQILEDADTLEQALEILQAAPARTSGAVLVGDGRQRRAAVVELARDRDDRKPRGDDQALVWATNHMLRESFERDAQNDRIRRFTSSGYRYDRLGELLAEAPVDPARAVAILRDRKGLGGSELGLGNRNAVDNLHLTHAVVVDATAMVMWVGEGPSALGRFRAIDLRHALGRRQERPAPLDDFPADRLLHSEEYSDYKEALEALGHARGLLARGLPEQALASASVALALAPDVGELHRLLGDIERELGDLAAARRHYERYLELVPGRLRDQERVRGLLEELRE
ncbi:C45 family autoproteolytic acyltransferase/hydolase [Nannocystis pusilla]|uniref:C45 family autoproteolytic acyltransferase/hydolase n=1 Tax=Nannocystis pusilla TaxID=889268 RepID=UPI003DA508F0